MLYEAVKLEHTKVRELHNTFFWIPKHVVLIPERFLLKYEVLERWISIIRRAGTAFSCVQ